jgi:hypothetical protein
MVPHVQARRASRSHLYFSESLGPGLYAGITEISGRGLARCTGAFSLQAPLAPLLALEGAPKTQYRHTRRSRLHFSKSLGPERM